MRQIKIKPVSISNLRKLSRKAVIILTVALVVGVSLGMLFGRNSGSEITLVETQTATVEIGDLTTEITAAGNLALALTEDLAFDIAGTVEEILVEVGDTVIEGQILAILDTDAWDKQLATLESAVLQAEVSLENAKDTLGQTKEQYFITVVDMSQSTSTDWCAEVEIAELRVDLAELQLEDTIRELEEALEYSPEVIAPFDGFITQVLAEGGDDVQKGTIAVQIADPDRFEAEILVSEVDIDNIELGSEASVSIEALDDLTLPAEVTHISPTAEISSGVVNYYVTVEVASLEDYIQEQQELMQQQRETMQENMPDLSSGELPEELQQAIDEGSMTEEEANAMMEQMQQAQGSQQGTFTSYLEDIELREGLTITVTVEVLEADDVLLIPVSAVMQRGSETYVEIMSADGTVEERTITVGAGNWQYYEVIDGLSEGEQIVLSSGTTTTTTTDDENFGGGGMMIPGGMGGGMMR